MATLLATSLKASSLFVFLLLLSLSNIIGISSSNVASDQLSFWSKNVRNIMPKAFVTKLSPLSAPDSEYYTSLLSQHTFTFYSNYCSKASVACPNHIIDSSLSTRSFSNGYLEDMVTPSSHQAKLVDPSMYFRFSNLEDGKIVSLPDLSNQFPPRAFLPSQMASKISLTSNEIQKLFPNSFSSPLIKEAIESTVHICNSPSNLQAGEIQGCVKSLEEMIEFSKNALGAKQLISMTSKSIQGSGKKLVKSKKQIQTKNIIYCHETFVPFVTYFCHMQAGYKLYSVDMIEPGTNNNDNAPVDSILTVCHWDTSGWPADHVALKALKLTPGKGEVCHFYSQMDTAFIGSS